MNSFSMLKVLGLPPADFIQAASRKRTFFGNCFRLFVLAGFPPAS